MYKWLTITGIVCLGFIIVLLSLGYALNKNEVATKALKNKLDQERLSASEPSPSKAQLTFVDPKQNKLDKLERYKNIIIKNVTCANTNQCVVVNTNEVDLNCIVAVNSIGASLLAKEMRQNSAIQTSQCEGKQKSVTTICEQNLCQLEAILVVQ